MVGRLANQKSAGGVALALAGFFLVKYSIDQNLLSPAVRVILGGLFGLGLLGAGHWLRAKPDLANGRRIAQSLSGAGLAVLYLALYAAKESGKDGWVGVTKANGIPGNDLMGRVQEDFSDCIARGEIECQMSRPAGDRYAIDAEKDEPA